MKNRLIRFGAFSLCFVITSVSNAQSFTSACYDGDIHRMEILVGRNPSCVTQVTDGYTPLDCETDHSTDEQVPKKNSYKVIEFLLDHGADPNRSPYVPDEHPDRLGVKMLKAFGGSGEAYKYQPTPFENEVWYAAYKDGSTAIIGLMIAHGANVNRSHPNDDYSPLADLLLDPFAKESNEVKIVGFLLDHGADPNFTDRSSGQTLLHWVVQRGNTKLAELLLKHGARVNARDNNGDTPLYFAKHEKHKQTADVIEKYGGTEE